MDLSGTRYDDNHYTSPDILFLCKLFSIPQSLFSMAYRSVCITHQFLYMEQSLRCYNRRLTRRSTGVMYRLLSIVAPFAS